MLELLALVILVAIFFGISLTAALHGIIKFVLIILGLCILLVIITPAAEKFWEWFTNVPPETPKPQVQPKPIKKRKKNTKANLISGWIVVFIICFLITGIIILISGVIETNAWRSMPIFIQLLVPHLPFIAILTTSLVRDQIYKKRASKH